MGFSDCILKCLNLDNMSFSSSYRVTIIGEKGAYIEGVLKIVDVKKEVIIVSVKGGKLNIYGNDLKLKSYCENDLAILGKVTKIELQN